MLITNTKKKKQVSHLFVETVERSLSCAYIPVKVVHVPKYPKEATSLLSIVELCKVLVFVYITTIGTDIHTSSTLD